MFDFLGNSYLSHHFLTALSETLNIFPIAKNEFVRNSCFKSSLNIGGCFIGLCVSIFFFLFVIIMCLIFFPANVSV